MTDKKKNLSKEFIEHFEEEQKLDATPIFNDLLAFRDELWEKIREQENAIADLYNDDLREFTDHAGNAVGLMENFTTVDGPLDWVVNSNVGKPENTFTNMHLTSYLDESVDIPHLGLAFGTLPDVFFYADLMPRCEVLSEPGYILKYLEPLNTMWVELQDEMYAANIKPFSAVMPFIRSSLSPVAMVGIVPPEFFESKVKPKILHYVEHWLGLLREKELLSDTTEKQRLKARDTLVRNNIVNLDPANAIAERIVGDDMAQRLYAILRAEERTPR